MKRFSAGLAVAALLSFAGWVAIMPARSAPPTVTPSPGYDARLQEQRNASTVHQPDLSARHRTFRRHVKQMRRGID
jgi:hypothetical protein